MPDEAPEFSVNVLPEALAIPSRRVELIGDADLTALPELLPTFTWVAPERPVLDAVPFNCAETFPGAAGTAFAGRRYFIPVARIATRTPTSQVPAVHLEREGDAWVLRLTLQLYRHDGIPEDSVPLNVGLGVKLQSPRGAVAELTEIVDEAPAAPGVIRQVVVSGPVGRDSIDLLKAEPGTTLWVRGWPSFGWTDAALLDEQGEPIDYLIPEEAFAQLTVDGLDLPAYFPPSKRANRPIYAVLDGTAGSDPDAWVIGPAGPWRASAPGEFSTLPHEYRLAFDAEHGLPAVTVLLLPPAADPSGAPASAYRVRVRFELVPWWDPELLDQLRTDIAENEATPYPEVVVGGYDAADFTPSTLFRDLGGDVLDQGTSAIDAQGFELVFDCSMEFYTLLCTLLAPASGHPAGLEGHVRFTLATGPDAHITRDVPVRIRLDVLADGYLSVEPSADGTGMRATVRNLTRSPVEVRGAVTTLLLAPGPGRPVAYPVPMRAQPLPFTLDGAGTGAETAVLTLTPATNVEPAAAAALIVGFTGIRLSQPAVSTLEQVHELAAATSQVASVRVASYQLAHPENLPASMADLYGIEVELRLGPRPAVTAFLTRNEPDKTVGLSLLIGDLVGGADPRQPKFDWRRRNLATSGTGEFSAWQTTIGRELFVTPVDLAEGAPEPSP